MLSFHCCIFVLSVSVVGFKVCNFANESHGRAPTVRNFEIFLFLLVKREFYRNSVDSTLHPCFQGPDSFNIEETVKKDQAFYLNFFRV